MKTTTRHSPEIRERAIRMVHEHRPEYGSEWAAMGAIAETIGCSTETLCKWVRRAGRDHELRAGLSSDERERLKALERENRELRRASEILRRVSFVRPCAVRHQRESRYDQ